MALIKCPNCQREVSDTASACPQCGRRLAAAATSPTAGPSIEDKHAAPAETEVRIIAPSEAEAASGREKLQHCVSTWKAHPALFLTKYPDQILILSLQDVRTDAWGFRLILTVDEVLFSGKAPPDPMRLACVWNQPYMSFDQGLLHAPYSFSLYFYPQAVPRVREIWAALPVARRSEPQTLFGTAAAVHHGERRQISRAGRQAGSVACVSARLMITPLERPLRRLVTIDGKPYVVTISPEGIRVVPKGRRKAPLIPWQDIVSGAVTLDAQLVGSLTHEAAKRQAAGKGTSGDAAG